MELVTVCITGFGEDPNWARSSDDSKRIEREAGESVEAFKARAEAAFAGRGFSSTLYFMGE